MNQLIEDIKKAYPEISFKVSDNFYWSPDTKQINYKHKESLTELDIWSMLHEIGHSLLEHKSYSADFMLIRLEVDAWEKAKEISREFSILIDENHIQDCLDTYRDWLYKRSICPRCNTKSFQQSDYKHYKCFNCHMIWRVTPSRFCRSYRVAEENKENSRILV